MAALAGWGWLRERVSAPNSLAICALPLLLLAVIIEGLIDYHRKRERK